MIRLQFHYLLNRVSVGFLVLSAVALSLSTVYASRFWEGMAWLDGFPTLGRDEFVRESVMVERFVLVATSLFLNIHCFWTGNSRFAAFFLSSSRDRIPFMAAKLAMIGLVLTGLTVHAWLSFVLTGFHLTPFFDWSFEETLWFVSLWTETLVFGLIQALIMQVADSVFSGIPPLLLFWWLESNASSPEGQTSFLYHLIPHLIRTLTGFSRRFEWSNVALTIVVLSLFNLSIFRFRDVK
jgi:hypothetical protein